MIIEVVILFTVVIIVTTYYAQFKYSYWKKKNVPYVPPTFPFGNMENLFTRKLFWGECVQMFYKEFKERGVKHGGLYILTSPNYLLIDPGLIKNVIQNDFQYFTERGFYYNEKDQPLSAHLFVIGGQKWRAIRTKVTPAFTSGKMKMMFDTLTECVKPMQDKLSVLCSKHHGIDIKDLLSRYTTDVVGTCVYGLDCNSFKSEDGEFRKHVRNLLGSFSIINMFKFLLATTRPDWARKLGIVLHPQDSTDFFMKVVKDTVKYRESNNISRKDLLQILIELKNSDSSHDYMTVEEIAAHSFIFFIAGLETSVITMTFCLYELATNLEVQDKARKEIIRVLASNGGNITYDAIMEMKYLNQVIEETLRKYPPVAFLTRKCVEDYSVPDTNVVIENGTRVIIPVLGLHKDPEYFEDPEKFDPERFSEDNKHKIQPFTYLPFGEGPRVCIGRRFAMTQIKVGLATLLNNYIFSVNRQTKLPLTWDKNNIVLTTETPIWLDVQKV